MRDGCFFVPFSSSYRIRKPQFALFSLPEVARMRLPRAGGIFDRCIALGQYFGRANEYQNNTGFLSREDKGESTMRRMFSAFGIAALLLAGSWQLASAAAPKNDKKATGKPTVAVFKITVSGGPPVVTPVAR